MCSTRIQRAFFSLRSKKQPKQSHRWEWTENSENNESPPYGLPHYSPWFASRLFQKPVESIETSQAAHPVRTRTGKLFAPELDVPSGRDEKKKSRAAASSVINTKIIGSGRHSVMASHRKRAGEHYSTSLEGKNGEAKKSLGIWSSTQKPIFSALSFVRRGEK